MTSKVRVEDAKAVQNMPAEYKELLVHQLLAHAEGELNGADNYILMAAPMAPNAYEVKVCYAGAADEMEHYIRTIELLDELGVDGSYMLKKSLAARQHYRTEILDGSHQGNWAARGLSSLLVEWAALEHIEEMAESSYLPLAAICPKIIEEEHVHIEHGHRITKALCEQPESRAAVQTMLDFMWGMVLDLFGKSESERSKGYLRWGLRLRGNEEARQRFIPRARAKLLELGLVAPPDHTGRKFN